ncbi:AAA family ATPase [uncultured Roseibium sp.]|uniref:AAA family ATPase n=1 Tax=uncultured Roseibium sp. TaxID=1936171 RepID=UPI0026285D76|nr:AAA family ATPase [uncultured Roseibium sp.]
MNNSSRIADRPTGIEIRRRSNPIQTSIREAVSWLSARPRSRNSIERTVANRFFETGPDLIDSITGAIACGQHVAVAGPRGCGKSYCISEAIKQAEAQGLLPPRGWIKVQGNKELPRDYLFEDDMTLVVNDGKTVLPKRKSAPLFTFAERSTEPDMLGRPVTDLERNVICYGLDENGQIDRSSQLAAHQRIVLFLDEVNRFSDGVLDSLLLLLEEGQVVMAGETFTLPVVVLMTMNPPGYDASARTLSPPLSSRIGRQYRLLSPRIDVLTDRIAPAVSERIVGSEKNVGLGSAELSVGAPPAWLVRRAAAVTLAAWGIPPRENADSVPGFDYLSGDSRSLLISMAALTPRLRQAMSTLNELCHFGPDGRALGDWMVAASVAARNEAQARQLTQAQAEARHFVSCAVTVLSHKLQDNFSSATRPDNTRRKEEALQVLVSEIMLADSPSLDALLRRNIDDFDTLSKIAEHMKDGVEADSIRATFLKFGIVKDSEVKQWEEFISSISPSQKGRQNQASIKAMIKDALLSARLAEIHDKQLFLSSPNARNTLAWLADTLEVTKQKTVALNDLLSEAAHFSDTSADVLGGHLFVADGVMEVENGDLLASLEFSGLSGLPRQEMINLFNALDRVWLETEHVGLDPCDTLCGLLEKFHQNEQISKETRSSSMIFAVEMVDRMASRPDRGTRTRTASRRVASFVAKYLLDLDEVESAPTPDAAARGSSEV